MKYRNLILASTPIVLTIVFTAILQVTVLSNVEGVKNWLLSFGNWFILAYICFQAVTIVIAPIGGAFIWLPMIAILGPAKGLVLSYIVSTPVFCVNFYLARRFGRGIVRRLIGAAALAKIDYVASEAGVGTLAVFKVFQGGYFDYVSYAAGLTKISWREFLLVNFLGGIPGAVVTYFVLSRFENFLVGMLALYVVTGIFIGISIWLNHRIARNRRRNG